MTRFGGVRLLAVLAILAAVAGAWAVAAERRSMAEDAVDVQAEFERARGMRPVAPTPAPDALAKSYVVAGAGTEAANGTYTRAGTHGEAPAFRNAAGWWLYRSTLGAWVIAGEAVDYDIPLNERAPYVTGMGKPDGRWSVGTAASPAPKVTAK